MPTMVPYKNNYTFGRGMALVSAFLDGTTTPDGNYRYIGNSSAVNINIAGTQLDHFSSDGGINELDESILTQVTRTATMTVDNINGPNLAMLMMGTSSLITQAAVAEAATEIFKAVTADSLLVPGISDTNPTGYTRAAITGIVAGSVVGVAGKDFILSTDLGGAFIPTGSNLIGLDVTLTFTVPELDYTQVLSGNKPFTGALRYVEENPAGRNKMFFAPSVRITPNGDFALKGDTWQAMPFTVSILKPASGVALYINDQPTEK